MFRRRKIAGIRGIVSFQDRNRFDLADRLSGGKGFNHKTVQRPRFRRRCAEDQNLLVTELARRFLI